MPRTRNNHKDEAGDIYKTKKPYGAKIQEKIAAYPDRLKSIFDSYNNTPQSSTFRIDRTEPLRPDAAKILASEFAYSLEKLRLYELNLRYVKKSLEKFQKEITDDETKLKELITRAENKILENPNTPTEQRMSSLALSNLQLDQTKIQIESTILEIDDQLKIAATAVEILKTTPHTV